MATRYQIVFIDTDFTNTTYTVSFNMTRNVHDYATLIKWHYPLQKIRIRIHTLIINELDSTKKIEFTFS